MLEEAEQLPQVYDDDCPKLTPAQLAEFSPVNFATWGERAQAMLAAGKVSPDEARVLKAESRTAITT
jgi:hypothetical protein